MRPTRISSLVMVISGSAAALFLASFDDFAGFSFALPSVLTIALISNLEQFCYVLKKNNAHESYRLDFLQTSLNTALIFFIIQLKKIQNSTTTNSIKDNWFGFYFTLNSNQFNS